MQSLEKKYPELKHIFRHFELLSGIPRETGNETAIQEALIELGKSFGWEVRVQPHWEPAKAHLPGNICLHVPGKGKGINAEPLAIQAHTDMVASAAKPFDFAREPITPKLEDRIIDHGPAASPTPQQVLCADGTTSGADNGLGVATALALVTSDQIADRPPLQLLFTIHEERGLQGAKHLDPSLVTARRMINLDTEDSDQVCVSCAGSRDLSASWLVERRVGGAPTETFPMLIKVKGLPGGHSGIEIHREIPNALKILGEILVDLPGRDTISRIGSNEPRNKIASEAFFEFWVSANDVPTIERKLRNIETKHAEWKLSLSIEGGSNQVEPYSVELSEKLATMLLLCPQGVISTGVGANQEAPRVSNNVGPLIEKDGKITLTAMMRSHDREEMLSTQLQLAENFQSIGAEVHFENESPIWRYAENSPTRDLLIKTYHATFGKDPNILVIHAGLECGVISENCGGIDVVSIGFDIHGAHTDKECVILSTLPGVWKWLKSSIGEMASS